MAAAGLSAVLASSAVAFNLIRWAGAAYLAYLGLLAFRTRRPQEPPGVRAPSVPLARSARKGLLVGLGNPKMVVFFLAFFPQFIHPAQGSQAGQMLILGAVFWVIGAIWDLAFAYASGTIGAWLHRRPASRPLSLASKDSPTSASPDGQPSLTYILGRQRILASNRRGASPPGSRHDRRSA